MGDGFTKDYDVWRLVYYEQFEDVEAAIFAGCSADVIA